MAKGSYIGQVQIGDNTYPVGSILYGVCDTAAETAAKVVSQASGKAYALVDATFNNDNLTAGVTIHIKFENSNTAPNPTLKVGAADAKSIKQYGTTAAGTNEKTSWKAGAVVSFTYDGTNWVMNTGIDSNDMRTPATNAPENISGTTNSTDTGTIGSVNRYAKEDHVHKLLIGQGANNGEISIGGATVKPKNIADAAYKSVSTSIPASGTADDAKLPTVAAVKSLVTSATAGLTGAMHFVGTTSTTLTDGATTATLTAKTTGSLSKTTGFAAGDVVIYESAEFVWNGAAWELLGDEGSYALKSSTDTIGSASGWNAGSTPTLGTAFTIPNITSVGSVPTLGTAFTIPNVTNAGTVPSLETENISFSAVNEAGSVTTASVANGTLTITHGTATTTSSKSVKAVKTWSAGSVPTLGTAFTVPNVTDVGAVPTLGTAFTVPNVTGVGSKPTLTITSKTVVVPGN